MSGRDSERPAAVSVVGLGKLGASIAAAIAARGVPVVGLDLNQDAVDAINEGRPPVFEPGLPEALEAAGDRLRATADYGDAIGSTDLTFVVVPTPSEADGSYSLRFAEAAFAAIGRSLRAKSGYHLVSLTSTVLPGAMRHGLLPILERESGRRVGPELGLCYSPEFVALGSVIRDFLHPDFLLIGEHDTQAGERLAGWYESVLETPPRVRRMSLENAELAKVALNSYVTMKIAFANMLSGLCEALPGGDVDAVTGALGLDSRIGERYLRGGMGYGGPCFPRDNAALRRFAAATGRPDGLLEATDQANDAHLARVIERVAELSEPASTVAVLGLAYKPGSDFVEASQGIALANALVARGLDVIAFDPLAGPAAVDTLARAVRLVDSIETAVWTADVLVVTNPDPAFAGLSELLPGDGRAFTLVDCWRMLDTDLATRAGVRYVPLGRGPAAAIEVARRAEAATGPTR